MKEQERDTFQDGKNKKGLIGNLRPIQATVRFIDKEGNILSETKAGHLPDITDLEQSF